MDKDLTPWYSLDWFTPSTLRSFTWENPVFLYLLLAVPVFFLLRWLITYRLAQKLPVALTKRDLKFSPVIFLALLPELYVPVSGFVVTPVLAYWEQPSPVAPVDPAETAAVARVPVAHLADPANRFRVRHPSGYVGAAFSAPGMLVWGFTAGLLNGLIALGGWEQPWDATDVRDLELALRATQ